MSPWRRASARRTGRDAQHPAASRGTRRRGGDPDVLVDEFDGVILLHSSSDASPWPDAVSEFARFLAAGEPDGTRTLVVGARGAGEDLWSRLGTVLDSLCERGVTTVRLALSGAGGEHGGRPAMAQRIADAWGVEVIAPDAGVVIVPGGSLFALDTGASGSGWRSFHPGSEPVPLGPRSPVPDWQHALARLPGHTAGGYVVEQVPAGVLVRPAGTAKPQAGDLCYAVPVDHDHPTVLVGAADSRGGADIPAEDLAGLLAALPAATRSATRLAPCGPVDLLPVAQDTAEILAAEVEVLTGLPLVVGAENEPVIRPVMVGADARPTWAPFAELVACRPYDADGGSSTRLVRWRSPMPGTEETEPGVVPLSARWQVSVTRAGLTVGPRGEAPALAGRPVSPEQLAIEVNLRGERADEPLFAGLSRLLSGFETGVREFVALHRVLPASGTDEEDFRLLRLAIEHGASLVEPPRAEKPPAPAAPTVRTVATPRTPPAERPPAAPAGHDRPEAREGTTSPTTSEPPGTPRPTPPAAPSPSSPSSPAASPAAPSPFSPASLPPAPPQARPAPVARATMLPPSLAKIPITPVTPKSPEPAAEAAKPKTPEQPKTARAQARGPGAPVSEAPASKAAKPEAAEPEAAKPGAAERETAVPESAKPEAAEPEAVKPEAAKPESAKPESAKLRTAEPEGQEPEAAVPSPAQAATSPSAPTPSNPPRAAWPRPTARPVRRSTERERAGFRSLAQPVWERHSASVNRAMTRMPALRGAQVDAARTDLVAVHLYLSGGLAGLDGESDAEAPGPYLACLASGLCRLPSYRGVVVRGGLPAEAATRLRPGTLLREPGPVSALPIGAGPPEAVGGYVIWSSTGRRVRPLLEPGAGAALDEVVFPPGAVFRVLEVRSGGPAPVVLLSQRPGLGPEQDGQGLDDADRATLGRLDEALREPRPSAGGAPPGTWPARCAEPLYGAGAAPGEPSAT